ncbi:MAG: sulfatase-like hydrolase/transferase [Saprospiraceae bacterium]
MPHFLLFVLAFFPLFAYAQPNFVIILTDDMGWTGTGVPMSQTHSSGSGFYLTPNLQTMAQQGMIFSQAYAPAPKCSPSRNAILTGQTTARNQFTETGNTNSDDRILLHPTTNRAIDFADVTIAEWLKSTNMNYQTAHFGKWHLNSDGPADHGFDESDGETSNNEGNNGGNAQADPKNIFSLTTKAIDFITQANTDGDPFFLQLSHYAVHTGVEYLQSTFDLYNDPSQRPADPNGIHTSADYAAMTEDTDTGVGQLLAAITNLGLDNNTYVIFTSDNGAASRQSSNAPLQQGKVYIYEGGIRVPFIVKGPNIPANTYETEPVVGYDLLPTIAALTGASTTLPADLDGQNIAPLFFQQSFQRSAPIFFHGPHYSNMTKVPRSAAVAGKYKFSVNYETGALELFDLDTDIGETTNIAPSEPTIFNQLYVAMRDHLRDVNANMPTLNPAEASFTGTGDDLDDDGMDDNWELENLLSYHYTATDDPDQDGKNNLQEHNDGSDPLVNETVLSVADYTLNATYTAPFIHLKWSIPATAVAQQLQLNHANHTGEWETISLSNNELERQQKLHAPTKNGVHYYRLQWQSASGETSFSPIASVTVQLANVRLSPNPVQDRLHIQTDIELEMVRVWDSSGKLVKTFAGNLSEIAVDNLSAGIYRVEVITESGNTVLPMVKE